MDRRRDTIDDLGGARIDSRGLGLDLNLGERVHKRSGELRMKVRENISKSIIDGLKTLEKLEGPNEFRQRLLAANKFRDQKS